MVLFELKLKNEGIVVHIKDFSAEISYAFQEGDVLESVNQTPVTPDTLIGDLISELMSNEFVL